MLLQRVITALVLLPLLLAAIWYLETPQLYAVFCGIGALMAWEWTTLMGVQATTQRAGYVALVVAVLAGVWLLPARESLLPGILGAALMWWVFALTLFPKFPQNLQQRPLGKPLMALIGLLMVTSTLLALAKLHSLDRGLWKLGYVLFIVFATDTGAYFAGRSFGKHKLAPNISPGKTIEGAIGGLLLCTAWALATGPFVFQIGGLQLALLVLLTVIAALFSIAGDLVESMFKRLAGVKDSGKLLPGHGGILDRVDAILAAAPIMTLGLLLTGL